MSKFLIEVQTMRQNTGNWKYDIKGPVEIINMKHIKRISPISEQKDIYAITLLGDDVRYPVIIDRTSYADILYRCNL
jgi:hypothetical protein